jgi:hypothetical protein
MLSTLVAEVQERRSAQRLGPDSFSARGRRFESCRAHIQTLPRGYTGVRVPLAPSTALSQQGPPILEDGPVVGPLVLVVQVSDFVCKRLNRLGVNIRWTPQIALYGRTWATTCTRLSAGLSRSRRRATAATCIQRPPSGSVGEGILPTSHVHAHWFVTPQPTNSCPTRLVRPT